jgi:hypothetical protein
MIEADRKRETLEKFGFHFGKGGAHAARTIMFEDLVALLDDENLKDARRDHFYRAIVEENCLSKKSGKTRQLTYRHLSDLYGLDASVPIFRVMLFFWGKDRDGRELLATLCAISRDALLRKSLAWIAQTDVGKEVSREDIEACLVEAFPDRFSPASLKSIAQNLNGTWTRAGHLKGKVRKVRQRVNPSPAATAFGLYLGYISGVRGEALFHTEFARVLDASPAELMDKAEVASRRGWIVVKRLGNIVEVLFPHLIKEEERALLNEQ